MARDAVRTEIGPGHEPQNKSKDEEGGGQASHVISSKTDAESLRDRGMNRMRGGEALERGPLFVCGNTRETVDLRRFTFGVPSRVNSSSAPITSPPARDPRARASWGR